MSILASHFTKTCPNLSLNLLFSKVVLKSASKQTEKVIPFQFSVSGTVSVRCSSDDSSNPRNPLSKLGKALKNDMKYLVSILDGHVDESNLRPKHWFPNYCDVLIVGGGVIGSSIAYWLQQRALNGLHVVVVEKDPSVINTQYKNIEYTKSSTALSAGGLRQQFSLPENIQMSAYGAEFLRDLDLHVGIEGLETPNVNFTPQGYLFLATEKGAETLQSNSKLQNSLGAKNELLTPKKIKEKWPWMNVDDLALGCHGLENEGWFDPWSLLMAFKKKAMSLGTEYVTAELTGFNYRSQPEMIVDGVEPGEYIGVNEANVKLPSGKIEKIQFSVLVVAAGCHSGEIGDFLRMGSGPGYLSLPLPIAPRKRYVYSFHCPDGPGMRAPFMIDPSGTYFRREGLGGNYICGRSPEPSEEPECNDLEQVDYEFFNEKVWPQLAQRVPAFENIKVKSGWAGYYDFNAFDENAFIGPHPGYMNVFLATGFSGHGLQQAPAVGRAIMELIIDGHYKTIDLTRMQFERVFHDEYLRETNIV